MNRSELQSNLAMTILLTSGAMLFATLFMGYAVFRTSANMWPPLGNPKVGLLLPLLSTLIIILSSWFCIQTRKAVKNNNLQVAHFNLNLTLLFGLGFMLSQMILWNHLKTTGLYVSSGIFASIMYGFTWIHAGHVALGIGSLIYLKIVLKEKTPNLLVKTVNVEKFWHFLDVIWIVMFLIIFVI